jgi:hypothetical protein
MYRFFQQPPNTLSKEADCEATAKRDEKERTKQSEEERLSPEGKEAGRESRQHPSGDILRVLIDTTAEAPHTERGRRQD